jgi:hypothetical protein
MSKRFHVRYAILGIPEAHQEAQRAYILQSLPEHFESDAVFQVVWDGRARTMRVDITADMGDSLKQESSWAFDALWEIVVVENALKTQGLKFATEVSEVCNP